MILILKVSNISRFFRKRHYEATEGKGERERQGKEGEEEGIHGEQGEGLYYR